MPSTEGEHCLPYPTRRAGFVAIGAAATSLIFPVRAQQQPSRSNLPSTPNLEIDPYYPIQKPIDQNADLTRVKGRKGRAEGRTILLAARVLGSDGTPVRNATIEIWQADSNGDYRSNFNGYGRIATDDRGAFSFTTIKPGRVPGGNGQLQAPHIAVNVFMRGLLKHLVTRVYFPDETSNAADVILQSVRAERRSTLIAAPIAGSAQDLAWNVVLQGEHETVFFDC